VFATPVDRTIHLARQRHAVVFLDTFICNAHTTAAAALWMGVSAITKPCQAFASRVAASLLNALGLDELIVKTNEDYVELACRLAEGKSFFISLKDKVVSNQQSTALFNTDDYTCALEHGFC
jgi:protein O-GlcNAc transferase